MSVLKTKRGIITQEQLTEDKIRDEEDGSDQIIVRPSHAKVCFKALNFGIP